MRAKRSYSAVDVEQIDIEAVVLLLTVGCIVAIDVAKTKFVAAMATAAGEVRKLLRFEHPRQTKVFLDVLRGLQRAELKPVVVMEPTGTYGDAVRHQCHALGLRVHMMPPKHSHDFAEVFDGVPSMHDPKAAAVLAKLQAIKPGRVWQPESDGRRELRGWVDRRRPVVRVLGIYHGHLEALMARHWPEFAAHVDVYHHRSWFALLKEFPGPQAAAGASEAAAEVLRKASRGHFSHARAQEIVGSARSTVGVPMTAGEQERLRDITEQIEWHTGRLAVVDAKLAELVEQDPVLGRMATVVGASCAAAIGALVGSPLDFTNARALEKAIGLNLKEKSSGNTRGQMKITKRGPGQVRQLLFMAALRHMKDDATALSWCRARKGYKGDQKMKAVVALMRKLTRALWHVARGEAYDPSKLFDTRRLDVASVSNGRSRVAAPASPSAAAAKVCEGGAAIA
jgi:transposase